MASGFWFLSFFYTRNPQEFRFETEVALHPGCLKYRAWHRVRAFWVNSFGYVALRISSDWIFLITLYMPTPVAFPCVWICISRRYATAILIYRCGWLFLVLEATSSPVSITRHNILKSPFDLHPGIERHFVSELFGSFKCKCWFQAASCGGMFVSLTVGKRNL